MKFAFNDRLIFYFLIRFYKLEYILFHLHSFHSNNSTFLKAPKIIFLEVSIISPPIIISSKIPKA
jgi:hypothetical protein